MSALPPRSIAVVLGTRPELVKLTELIRLLGPAAHVVHTGQHYDEELSGRFLTDLGIPEPTYLTGIGGRPRAVQISAALAQLDAVFCAEPPRAVVVQGDTNAALSGALDANARAIPLVHVEAGLRSHDRNMPEEHNRVLIDRIADVLCAATPENRDNLLAEGIPAGRIEVTGNTVVEAVRGQLPTSAQRFAELGRLGLVSDGYVLATVHRPENTDDPASLRAVLAELASLAAELPVVLPLHPRTRARVEAAGLGELLDPLLVTPPLGYRTFLALAQHAALLVSDSGESRRRSRCSAVPWSSYATPRSGPRRCPTSPNWSAPGGSWGRRRGDGWLRARQAGRGSPRSRVPSGTGWLRGGSSRCWWGSRRGGPTRRWPDGCGPFACAVAEARPRHP